MDYKQLGTIRRQQILDIFLKTKAGHLPSCFSIVDILNVLYESILRYDPTKPDWDERDRFILSKGHGALALYHILSEKKFFDPKHLDEFCSLNALLGGHPSLKVPGVEFPTGSLGHGLAAGIGMSLSSRIRGKNYRVFVLLGDGECNEGSVWESALLASKHKLSNLVVLIDHNKMQSSGSVEEICPLGNLADKWKAFGFKAMDVDMKTPEKLEDILRSLDSDKPKCIVCHTIKGQGHKLLENNLKWHHKTKISDEEMRQLCETSAWI